MQNLLPALAGQRVEVRGEVWQVVGNEPFDDCALLTLRGAGDSNLGITTVVLTPFDRVIPVRASTSVARAPRRAVLARAARAVAQGHRWAEPWTAAAAAIDLLPWQLEPAIAAVSGATRLLLADDVGLGKTIQAGLVIAELRARGLISRVIVLTPASLREQWAVELRERFALQPQLFDHAAISRLTTTLPVGVNPWSTLEVGISSIDLVKRVEVRTALDAVPIDLLVVDEAHHLRPGTDRAALVADLASRATWVVLATATPHSGDQPAYSLLCGLGACAPDDQLLVFRRSARDVGRARDRRVRFKPIDATAAERALLDQTLAYARALWTAHAGAPQAALVASVICRRAVSSPGSLASTLARRRELLGADNATEQSLQPELPWLEHEPGDDLEADDVLGGGRLSETATELAWLDRLLALAQALAGSSAKFDTIERLLRRTSEPAILFSEYRHTLTELARRLENRVSVALLHGGLSARERRDALRRFLNGNARVLLATDAAGEGLNLQARCRLVINVELPWNPVRLEQRIGRVDRLGQTRPVHALHLYHRGSFEDRVLARLHRRMQQAASSDLRNTMVSEQQVAAAVLGDRAVVPAIDERGPAGPATFVVDDVAMRRRASRVAVETRGGARRLAAPLCAALPARGRTAAMTLLFEIDIHAGDGRLISRDLLPLLVRLSASVRAGRHHIKALTMALSASAAVTEALRRASAASVERAAASSGPAARLIEARLSAIARALEDRRRPLVQTSLFDRRAERQARASETARELLQAHARRRLGAARALRTAAPGARPRLVGAWPVSG